MEDPGSPGKDTDGDLDEDIIGVIYGAALEPSRWPAVMTALARLGGADKALITSFDKLNPASNLLAAHNVPAPVLSLYQQSGVNVIEMEFVRDRWLSHVGLGVPSLSHEYFGSKEGFDLAGGAYVQALRLIGIHHQASVMLETGDYCWSAFGFSNGKDQPFDAATKALMARLAPHLRRALQIHRQLTTARRHNVALYDTLNRLDAGIILLNGQGAICYANPRASAITRRSRVLHISLRNHLSAGNAADNKKLQALITAVLSREPVHLGQEQRTVSLMAPGSDHPLVIIAAPLAELSGYNELAADSVAAVLFISDPDIRYQLSEAVLAERYALSPREIQICQIFINTPVLTDIAEASQLTLQSVRSYFKGIYEKTGHRSQAELMRLLLSLASRSP